MTRNVPTQNILESIFDRPVAGHFPSLWSNFFDVNPFQISEDVSTRGIRIYEEKNQLHVEVPLPGLTLSDIEVTLNKGVLWVKGESKQEEQDKKRRYYRSSQRSYSYSIVLPTQIEEKQEPHAVYVDGVLNIELQLAKHAETKKISVKAGNSKK